VAAAEASAAFHQEPGHLRQMRRFVAGDSGHGLHPPRRPIVGPAGHQLHGIIRGLLFEKRVIDEERDRIGEDALSPFARRAGKERQFINRFAQVQVTIIRSITAGVLYPLCQRQIRLRPQIEPGEFAAL